VQDEQAQGEQAQGEQAQDVVGLLVLADMGHLEG
jgi:hypothetical protein